jgi:peptidoglycan/xylan/chitin deacetylase (PgdA/CDA1 family)
MSLKIPIDKVQNGKISVSFTWDDNSSRHKSIIAPLFLENAFRCTFYIVPGDEKFDSLYASEYYELQNCGFEVGSHSYSHKYMTLLSQQNVEFEFRKSAEKILECVNRYPLTFAFPNHDYNGTLIENARMHHIETRNTLSNSIRFSIKTDTALETLTQAVEDAIFNKTNLVFSAHSIITEEEYLNKESGEGYQPLRSSILSELLQYLKKIITKVDVITFSQSALREWIKSTAILKNKEFIINPQKLKYLEKFYVTQDNIIDLL